MKNFKKLLLTLMVVTGTMTMEATSQPMLKNNTSYQMIVSFISSNNTASMTNPGLANTLCSVPANTSISIPAGYDTISAIESQSGLNMQNAPTLQSTTIKANKSYQINSVQHNSTLQLVQM